MYGMAQAADDLLKQGAPASEAAIPILSQRLKADLAEREVRPGAHHRKAARFPACKDLSDFDAAASEINEATVRTLPYCEFMDGGQNVVLIGDPGTGKTHVTTALGIQAIEHHRRMVRFFSAIRQVNALEPEKATGTTVPCALTQEWPAIHTRKGEIPTGCPGTSPWQSTASGFCHCPWRWERCTRSQSAVARHPRPSC